MLTNRKLGGAAADHAGPSLRPIGQEHVVEHREIRCERHFLEGSLHAVPVSGSGRVQAHLFAEQADGATVRLDETGKQLDDRRFAGAVLAEQGVRYTLLDRETDIVNRERRAERLAQVMDSYSAHGLFRHGCSLGKAARKSRDGTSRPVARRVALLILRLAH